MNMSEEVGAIPTPNQQLYDQLAPENNKKASDGTKSTQVELTSTLDSTYSSGAFEKVNANQKQADSVEIN
jgi:hypothetical protein